VPPFFPKDLSSQLSSHICLLFGHGSKIKQYFFGAGGVE